MFIFNIHTFSEFEFHITEKKAKPMISVLQFQNKHSATSWSSCLRASGIWNWKKSSLIYGLKIYMLFFDCNFLYWAFLPDYCIPRQSRGYLGFRSVTPPPLQRFSSPHDNWKTICPRPFIFGMWVYMVDVSSEFEFRPWPSTNRPIQAT